MIGSRRRILRRAALSSALLAAALALPVAHAGAFAYGVDTSAVEADFDDAPQAQTSARYASMMGAHVERMGISWKAVERQPDPNPAHWNWKKYDDQIAAIQTYGMRPLIMLHDAPYWARPDLGCSTKHCPPDANHYDDWAVFARQVVKRYYSKGLAAVEIWNSPNTQAWWPVKGGPDPAQYARVYSWAANAIHKQTDALNIQTGQNITIPVLFCSCGGNGFQDTRNDLSIPTFLQGFYNAVNNSVFRRTDSLSIHAYPSLNDLDTNYQSRFLHVLTDARDVRDQYDPIGSERKIWLTEIGISTSGPDSSRFTPQQQAQGLVGAISALLHSAQRPTNPNGDIAGIFVFTLVEPAWSSRHPETKGYGIVARAAGDGLDPKPAYCALANMAGKPRPPGC